MPKKRANGEGSIRKRSDGRWEGRYTVGHDPVTGKQIFKNVLGKTQAEVRDKLAAAIAEGQKIDVVVSDKMCVCDWMDTWLEKPNMRASTYESYEGNIRLHVKPGIGDLTMSKVTTLDLQKFFNALLTEGRIERKESKNKPKGLSIKTVSNIRTMLYSAFEKAVAEHLILTNPVAGCKLPKREKQEMKTMPVEDLGRFFAEAKASGKFEFYYVEFSTGLRRGELLGLKWEDVDYEKKTLTIRRQVIRVQGHIEEGPLKTKNAYRTVAIGDDVIAILKDSQEREGKRSPYPMVHHLTPSLRSAETALDSGNMVAFYHGVFKNQIVRGVRYLTKTQNCSEEEPFDLQKICPAEDERSTELNCLSFCDGAASSGK